MDYRNNKNKDPWDEQVYGTGNTMPPKSYSGIIALLLVLVIFLSGIVSLLSFMNIKLFHELSQQQVQNRETQAPMSFSDLDTHSQPELHPQETIGPSHLQPEISIHLNKSPQSVDNVPQMGAMSWQDIYQKMHCERQKLIEPVYVPEDLFVKNWEAVTYEGKGFDVSAPEFYTAKNERVRSKSEWILPAACGAFVPFVIVHALTSGCPAVR